MDRVAVTFTGEEVAILAACLCSVLPHVNEADFEVVDLMLDRALAALPGAVSPATHELIEKRRAAGLARHRQGQ